jgi:hypothetical protein
MAVSARMRCTNINDYGQHREVFFEAIYSDDKSSPNYSYSQYTPSASLRMVITNPAAYELFKAQAIYDLIFTEHKAD